MAARLPKIMYRQVLQPRIVSGLRVRYERHAPDWQPDADVLAHIAFTADSDPPTHPCGINVGLQTLHGTGLSEVWRGDGAVRYGRSGAIRFSEDARHLFGVIEIDEREHTDIGTAASAAYAAIVAFQRGSAKPHMLRMWNYFDAITRGEGDDERYQRFCVGRAEGLGAHQLHALPAATAIGRRDGNSILQIYWLAATTTGHAIENPRQISAYHYPRQYGRVAPRFARAMLNAHGELLISGTASVVGHATHHDGDVAAQLGETLLNLDSLLQQAHARDARCPLRFSDSTLLKVYLRYPETSAAVIAELYQHLPQRAGILVLAADICRDDLLIEIDGLHL
jgi:chorismate lyase / 3-hydroxybenzoate synthase